MTGFSFLCEISLENAVAITPPQQPSCLKLSVVSNLKTSVRRKYDFQPSAKITERKYLKMPPLSLT